MKGDLYIATRSDRPDICKVGRSYDVKKRCATLSASQCFTIDPAHVYPGGGDYEKDVHIALREHRVGGGSSREWFKLSAADAKKIIDGGVLGKGSRYMLRVIEDGYRMIVGGRELSEYERMMREIGIPVDEEGDPVDCTCERRDHRCTCGVNGAICGYLSD